MPIELLKTLDGFDFLQELGRMLRTEVDPRIRPRIVNDLYGFETSKWREVRAWMSEKLGADDVGCVSLALGLKFVVAPLGCRS